MSVVNPLLAAIVVLCAVGTHCTLGQSSSRCNLEDLECLSPPESTGEHSHIGTEDFKRPLSALEEQSVPMEQRPAARVSTRLSLSWSTDRAIATALMQLYDNTGGDSWESSAGWGTNATFCDWYGIYCYDQDFEVYLPSNNLRGALPTAWGLDIFGSPIFSMSGLAPQTCHVARRNLRSNAISGTVPSDWAAFNKLEWVTLRENLLSGSTCPLQPDADAGTLPSEWGRMPKISEVGIHANAISGTLPSEWSNLPLTELRLRDNRLRGTLPTEWGALVKLTTFDVRTNELCGTLPSQYARMTGMDYFSVFDNAICGTLPAQYASFTRVRRFYVSSSRLTGTLPPQFGAWSRLLAFWIQETFISGTLPQTYSGWTNMIQFTVSGSLLSGPLPSQLASWTKLQYFYGADVRWSGSLPTQWAAWASIVHLYVDKSALTGPLPTQWRAMTNILRFRAEETGLSGPLPVQYGNWTALTAFRLSSPNISGVLPTTWGSMTNLAELVISGTAISGTIPAQWSQFEALRELVLADNQLCGTIPPVLFSSGQHLPLSVLDFSDNGFRGLLPPALTKLPLLHTIDLSRNPWGTTLAALLEPIALRNSIVPLCRMAFVGVKSTWPSPCIVARLTFVDEALVSGTIPGFIVAIGGHVSLRGIRGLRGSLPSVAQAMQVGTTRYFGGPDLTSLDVSSCPLSGSIPLFLLGPQLSVINATNTSLSLARDDGAMDGIRISGAQDVHRRPGFQEMYCPILRTSGGGLVDVEPTYFNWTLCECRVGDAGVSGKCLPCPAGASCPGGANKLNTRWSFWCDPLSFQSGTLSRCEPCPAGYCCDQRLCPYEEQCTEGRVGALCGECKPGFTAILGSPKCIKSSDCEEANWLIPVTIGISIVVVFGFACTFHPLSDTENAASSSRHLEEVAQRLVFFFQISSLLDVQTGLTGLSAMQSWLASIFNLSFDQGSGLCVNHQLSQVGKEAYGFVLPGALLVSACVVNVGVWLSPLRNGPASSGRQRAPQTKTSFLKLTPQGVLYAFFSIVVISYKGFLKTTFALLNCRDIPDHGRSLVIATSTKCFTSWQQGLFLQVVLLALFPVLLLIWFRRAAKQADFVDSAVHSMLQPYQPGTTFFFSIDLLERFVLVLLYSFIQMRNRSWFLFVFLTLMLCMHFWFKPYRRPSTQNIDTWLLLSLILLAAVSIVASVYVTEDVERGHERLDTLALASGLLQVICPSVCVLPLLIHLVGSHLCNCFGDNERSGREAELLNGPVHKTPPSAPPMSGHGRLNGTAPPAGAYGGTPPSNVNRDAHHEAQASGVSNVQPFAECVQPTYDLHPTDDAQPTYDAHPTGQETETMLPWAESPMYLNGDQVSVAQVPWVQVVDEAPLDGAVFC